MKIYPICRYFEHQYINIFSQKTVIFVMQWGETHWWVIDNSYDSFTCTVNATDFVSNTFDLLNVNVMCWPYVETRFEMRVLLSINVAPYQRHIRTACRPEPPWRQRRSGTHCTIPASSCSCCSVTSDHPAILRLHMKLTKKLKSAMESATAMLVYSVRKIRYSLGQLRWENARNKWWHVAIHSCLWPTIIHCKLFE